jgi:regulator of extracellular matrix RemA (YlzA/DUF370 family)
MASVLINIGHNNVVAADQVVAIVNPNSAPSKRLKDDAREAGRLVDSTQGHRTRSLIVTCSNHVILTAVEVKTLTSRFNAALSDAGPKELVKEVKEIKDAKEAEVKEVKEVKDGGKGGKEVNDAAGKKLGETPPGQASQARPAGQAVQEVKGGRGAKGPKAAQDGAGLKEDRKSKGGRPVEDGHDGKGKRV